MSSRVNRTEHTHEGRAEVHPSSEVYEYDMTLDELEERKMAARLATSQAKPSTPKEQMEWFEANMKRLSRNKIGKYKTGRVSPKPVETGGPGGKRFNNGVPKFVRREERQRAEDKTRAPYRWN